MKTNILIACFAITITGCGTKADKLKSEIADAEKKGETHLKKAREDDSAAEAIAARRRALPQSSDSEQNNRNAILAGQLAVEEQALRNSARDLTRLGYNYILKASELRSTLIELELANAVGQQRDDFARWGTLVKEINAQILKLVENVDREQAISKACELLEKLRNCSRR